MSASIAIISAGEDILNLPGNEEMREHYRQNHLRNCANFATLRMKSMMIDPV